MVDIVKGAVDLGVRYLAFYEENSDLVRITGYLVKRSEMEKYRNEQAVLQNTTRFGVDALPSTRGGRAEGARSMTSAPINRIIPHSLGGWPGQPHGHLSPGLQPALPILPQPETQQLCRHCGLCVPEPSRGLGVWWVSR